MMHNEITAETKKIKLTRAAMRWGPMIVLPIVGYLFGFDLIDIFVLVVAFFIGKIIDRFIGLPLENRRLDILTNRMLQDLSEGKPAASSWRWWYPKPGALIVTTDDKIELIDAISDFKPLVIFSEQIVRSSVQVEATTVANTKTSGSLMFGKGFTGGFAAGFSGSSRSTTTFQTHETYTVEIMWRSERNTTPHCVAIPANDRRTAEGLQALFQGLVMQAPLRDVRAKQPAIDNQGPLPAAV